MDGQVVHARRGQREAYEMLRSTLCSDAKPASMLAGLLRLFPFRTVYIADLDALLGKMPQTGLIRQLTVAFPEVRFWIDCGLPAEIGSMDSRFGRISPVIGSESLLDDHLGRLRDMRGLYILSLDFRDQTLAGAGQLLQRADLWPDRVILMNLSRVGSFAGPDIETAAHFISNYPGHSWVAAGGVRDEGDLEALARQGLSGVLVASALHNGAIDRVTLQKYDRPGHV